MEAHVVEAGDVGQIVLADREAELRLVDLYPRRSERVQERQRLAERVAPALMPQLDGGPIAAERAQEIREIVARGLVVLEAGRKLREQRTELARRRQRIDAAAELV